MAFYQRRFRQLLRTILSVVAVLPVLAFVGPAPAIQRNSCRRQRCQRLRTEQHGNGIRRRHQCRRLRYREGVDDDGNGNTADSSSAAAATATSQPSSNQSSSSSSSRTATTTLHEAKHGHDTPMMMMSTPPKNDKSTLRLMKARRLLEIAQITPSQRLETMQVARMGTNNDDYFATVVPMGSYSMRFGGFGSLEEELGQPPPIISQTVSTSSSLPQQHNLQQLRSMYKYRMADTFDSVDNLVDSESSLLPGGRWMTSDDGGGSVDGGNSSSSSSSSSTPGRTQSRQQRTSASTLASLVTVAEPLVKYDPIAAEKLLFVQPTKWLVRNVQIAFPLGLWLAGILMDTIFAMEKANRKKRARELNTIIGSLGPAIISKCSAIFFIYVARSFGRILCMY